MITFLPYSDFVKTATCLDYKRLGKQRVEAMMILKILLKMTPESRWKNHPAVKMWMGHEPALAEYGSVMCDEWRRRGYIDNLGIWFMARSLGFFLDDIPVIMPKWIKSRKFLVSHRSNLVRKLPEHYRKFFHNVPNNLLYIWPI
jgi:hypothetical protein